MGTVLLVWLLAFDSSHVKTDNPDAGVSRAAQCDCARKETGANDPLATAGINTLTLTAQPIRRVIQTH